MDSDNVGGGVGGSAVQIYQGHGHAKQQCIENVL